MKVLRLILPALLLVMGVATALATALVTPLSPGDTFDVSCPYPIASVNYAGTHVTGACPTPTLTPTPVPTATPTPVPLVWMRPSMTMLAESVGYTDAASCQYNHFGCGAEPLFAWQGVSPAACGYVAHGADDDHVWIAGQFSAPTLIYGVRISSWGGANADILTIDFRATSDTSPDDDAHVWVPPVTPFVTLSGPLTSNAMTRLTGMVNPPVTTQYVRFEATNTADWVTGSDLEYLVPSGTAGQPAC